MNMIAGIYYNVTTDTAVIMMKNTNMMINKIQ